MLVIRLFRVGKKNQPFFKIVVTDKRKPPRAGRFVEQVGFYNPLTKEKDLKQERIQYWLSVGAKPSDTVYNLLITEKIIEGKKIDLHKKSKKEKKEEILPIKEKPAKKPAKEPVEKPLGEEDKSSSSPIANARVEKEPVEKVAVKKETPKTE